jgi:hypothetical protein
MAGWTVGRATPGHAGARRWGFSHDSSHTTAGKKPWTRSLKLHTSSDGARPSADGKDEVRQREALGVPSENLSLARLPRASVSRKRAHVSASRWRRRASDSGRQRTDS